MFKNFYLRLYSCYDGYKMCSGEYFGRTPRVKIIGIENARQPTFRGSGKVVPIVISHFKNQYNACYEGNCQDIKDVNAVK